MPNVSAKFQILFSYLEIIIIDPDIGSPTAVLVTEFSIGYSLDAILEHKRSPGCEMFDCDVVELCVLLKTEAVKLHLFLSEET